jgi:hypothetical protein
MLLLYVQHRFKQSGSTVDILIYIRIILLYPLVCQNKYYCGKYRKYFYWKCFCALILIFLRISWFNLSLIEWRSKLVFNNNLILISNIIYIISYNAIFPSWLRVFFSFNIFLINFEPIYNVIPWIHLWFWQLISGFHCLDKSETFESRFISIEQT